MSIAEPESTWCERLYQEKAAELLLYGRALGLSHSEAEDVLHEVFATLLKLKEKPAEPGFYAVKCLRNRTFNYKRSLWRRVVREFESAKWFEKTSSENPAEAKAMLCLRRLPPEQREVIVLKIWHERTFEEIGRLVEISPNTAAGRYRYGMARLKQCLEKESIYEGVEFFGTTVAGMETSTTR